MGMQEEEERVGEQEKPWTLNLAPLLSTFRSLNKSFYLAEPQFPLL